LSQIYRKLENTEKSSEYKKRAEAIKWLRPCSVWHSTKLSLIL
jgi:hypothetical protein